jgi:hypothetical protein
MNETSWRKLSVALLASLVGCTEAPECMRARCPDASQATDAMTRPPRSGWGFAPGDPEDAAVAVPLDADLDLDAQSPLADAMVDASPDGPCARDNGGCEERCTEVQGTARCECDEGQELDPDGRACRSWHKPRFLGSQGDTAGHVRLAVDHSAHAVAVWEVESRTVHASRYDPASDPERNGGWSDAQRIDEQDDNRASEPEVVMDGEGTALIAWRVTDRDRNPLHIATRRVTASGNVTAVATIAGKSEARLAMAGDGAGNAFLVWEQEGSVWVSHYRVESESWDVPAPLEPDAEPAYAPRLVADASGHAVAAWWQSGGIWAAHYDAATLSWGAPLLIASSAIAPPAIGLYDAGHAVAVWGAVELNIARYEPGAGWRKGTSLTGGVARYQEPQVAVDEGGTAFVVWQHANGIGSNLVASRHETTTGWSTPVALQSGEGVNARDPEVAVEGAGRALAVWTGSGITVARHGANGWGMPSGFSAAELRTYASEPALAVDPVNHRVHLAWHRYFATFPPGGGEVDFAETWATRYE